MEAEMEDRIEELERKITELTAEIEKLKKPEPEPLAAKGKGAWPKRDWTEGMTAGPGLKPMVDLIPDRKDQKFSEHAWSQTRMGEPGGFGPGPGGKWSEGSAKVKPENEYKPPKP